MNRSLQVAAALLAATASAAAQAVTPTPQAQGADTGNIIFAPKAPASLPAATPAPGTTGRSVSPAIAANLSVAMPAYSPEAAAPNGGAPAMDLREFDKPKNQIPRLPVSLMQKYMVRESRLPVFRKLDLYTTAGLIDLSFKEHPGLHFGNFFNLNAKVAHEMIVEEELRAEKRDLADTVRAMAIAGDEEEALLMQQAVIDEAFRSYDSTRK
jgi:hypothetical protein